MSIFKQAKLAACVALGLALPGAAAAATLSEGSVGDFSGNYLAPTVIANGFGTIDGVWSGGNDYDLLALTGLRTGAQTVTISFAPITPIGDRDWSFSAGGTVNWKTTPFRYSAWEGDTLARVGITHRNRGETFDYTLTLGDGFQGQLWLGLFNTHGSLRYSISAPGNAALAAVAPPEAVPSSVPLPGALPLMALAVGALGGTVAVRRRRTAASA